MSLELQHLYSNTDHASYFKTEIDVDSSFFYFHWKWVNCLSCGTNFREITLKLVKLKTMNFNERKHIVWFLELDTFGISDRGLTQGELIP